jgi:uncharacterized domain 1
MKKNAIENRGLDPELFDFICHRHDSHNCNNTMGMEISYLGKGIAGIRKIRNHKLSTVGGFIHGGVLAALADAVMGEAAETLGGLYKTVNLNVNYTAPALDEEIVAEGYIVHPGRTMVFSECKIFNKKNQVIATGTGAYIRNTKNR